MKDITKYQGVIPAFYACYDKDGNISVEGVKALTRHLISKGVKGVYVGGSSGECIYQHVDERKKVLEAVMEEAKGKLTVIAHVGCNNTADSVELAAHAQSVGADAIASIPPIYFHLPEYAIAEYWNAMSAAAPDLDFVIYNIPQLAGTALSMNLLKEMLKNPNVIAVKNSSMPTQDIQLFKAEGVHQRGENGFVVFNGPDEQFVSGRAIGADGGIGGTQRFEEIRLPERATVGDGSRIARRLKRCHFDSALPDGDERRIEDVPATVVLISRRQEPGGFGQREPRLAADSCGGECRGKFVYAELHPVFDEEVVAGDFQPAQKIDGTVSACIPDPAPDAGCADHGESVADDFMIR